jgi:hypothetical protein
MFSDIPLTDEDHERLNIIRRAIAAGTYRVNPHDVAVKLILSMLEFGDDLSMCEETSSSDVEVEGLRRDEKEG